MRHVTLLGLAALAFTAPLARPAAAQGLLHKHRHVAGPAMGAMRPLPTQASSVAVAATGDVSSADGAAITVPANPGATGGAPGIMPICIVPTAPPTDGVPIDAVPMPMPWIDGGPSVAWPADPSLGGPPLPPLMFIGGRPGASGPPVSGGAGGLGTAPPGHPLRGPGVFGHARGEASPVSGTAMSANTFGPGQTANAEPPGRSIAAGLPGRAVGVRPGTLDVPGRRHMTPIGPAASGPDPGSSAAVPQDPGVIQAAGTAPRQEGATRNARNALPHAAGTPATTPPPRWRDRLRFAWPTVR